MGITISHRSGAIPEKVVDHIITQLEDKYKREGYVEGCEHAYPLKGRRSRCYFKVDEKPIDRFVESWKKNETVSAETGNANHWISEYERTAYLERGTPTGVRNERYLRHAKKELEDNLKRDLFLPNDFNPTKVKGICLNPDTGSETFCVQFVKDGDKDEWREPPEFTKTQYVKQEGVHIELCEYLSDIKRKIENAGSHFKITDEAEYCDDENPSKSRDRLVHNMEENRKVIDSVGKMLAGESFSGAGVVVEQVKPLPSSMPEGVEPGQTGPTGTLEDYMALRRADLLVSVRPRRGIQLIRVAH